MEDAARKTSGVQAATVNLMTQKMIVEFGEGKEPATVLHTKAYRTALASERASLKMPGRMIGDAFFGYPINLKQFLKVLKCKN